MRSLPIAIPQLLTLSLLLTTAACAVPNGEEDGISSEDPPAAAAPAPSSADDPFRIAANDAPRWEDPFAKIAPDLHTEVSSLSMYKQFGIVWRDPDIAARATAALEVPIAGQVSSSGLPVRGTCGVTFISPHYAVTASHCVSSANVPDPANTTIPVRSYSIADSTNMAMLYPTAFVDGAYPHYTSTPYAANQIAGYSSTTYSCKVVSRCSYGPLYNCDSSADIAMLYCSNRASNAPWVPVAGSDPGVGPVEMYWFHELLTMPTTQPPPGAAASDVDRFTHYTALTPGSGEKENWHYLAASTNALLPLKSIPWSGGIPRQRLGGTVTDLYGCHGTSGSGVFQRNSSGNLELLGPVTQGGSWSYNRLCNDPDAFQPGQYGLSYLPNTSTRMLQSKFSRQLLMDRTRVIVIGPSLPLQP